MSRVNCIYSGKKFKNTVGRGYAHPTSALKTENSHSVGKERGQQRSLCIHYLLANTSLWIFIFEGTKKNMEKKEQLFFTFRGKVFSKTSVEQSQLMFEAHVLSTKLYINLYNPKTSISGYHYYPYFKEIEA